jgi:hypothetical protein
MIKEMRFGRVDILWPKSQFPCPARRIRIRTVFILAVWEEAKIGVLKSRMQTLTGASGVIDTPKISDFVLAISKCERNT